MNNERCEKQTLMATSLKQEDGITVVQFSKYLKEEDQFEVLSDGLNSFIFAQGQGNSLRYHGPSPNRGRFEVDFSSTCRSKCYSLAPVSVSSYDMLNGGSYPDSSYPGGPFAPYEALSGGVGELTDGVVATVSWPDERDSYVGWDFREIFQDTNLIPITLFFGQDVTITKLKISVDDPVGNLGGIKAPKKVSIGGTEYEMEGPITKTIELLAPIHVATGNGFGITLIRDDTVQNCVNLGITCPWIFVSEIELIGCSCEE